MVKDIVLAGLLHDVGKFAERGSPQEFSFSDAEAARFQWAHAAATEKFLRTRIQWDGSRQPPWFNYAAMHHKPSDSSPMEWMIAEADRLSSGMERASYAADEREGGTQKFKTPLKPVTEFVALEDDGQAIEGRYYLPLRALQPDEANAFPREAPESLDLRDDYQALFRQFDAEFEKLLRHDIDQKIDTLYFLLQKFWWAVPSTTRKRDFPDVSLFEHAKTTAALASCLYVFHKADNTLNDVEKIKNRAQKKFLLFSGDLGGIQNFIYQISSKGAYSLLKGRSFYIQILSDLAAEHFAEALGLTRVNIIYSSGGKFYLLLPNTPQTIETITGVSQAVNEDLFDKFSGAIHLRSAFTELSGDDLMLKNGRLWQKWEAVNRGLQRQAQQPFITLLKNRQKYKDYFGPGKGDLKTCDACHGEAEERELKTINNAQLCPVCVELLKKGEQLKKARYLVLTREKKAGSKFDLFLGKRIYLHQKLDTEWLQKLKSGDQIFQFNDTCYDALFENEWFKNRLPKERLGAADLARFQLGFKHYGGTRKLDATFDEIAGRGQTGFEKLGVLRMDVDNLGMIFSRGLRHYRVKSAEGEGNGHFYSLARLTTLSGQLSLFFSGYLNQLIADEEAARCAIVYAGGDDLFIVGAWDVVMEKALEIRKKFAAFTCYNPAFTMSGGLTITGGKFPIYKSAEYAGQAEETAKKFSVHGLSKNAFTAFGLPLSWNEWFELENLKEQILQNIQKADGRYDRALVNHLWRIVEEYQKRYLELQRQSFNAAQIKNLARHERWLWRMVYDLTRFKERNRSLSPLIDELMRLLAGDEREKAGARPFIELLPTLTQWVDYLTR
ncbi:type III-A CRISPR-associated protein Cas10/Csm1 [Caldithrix abyssi]|uniref:CRISPR system single-strand-specific deoxyribonuclease Cas10/Csm1 (subtype III-A) n=1 Tax=Caldithrix abyssi DSM 13497 TaxID=880073 RepID=H1XX21_CALAY|nr:type III-A CRISPR-associated protein Cas10/Csm1 [Caldithrix abyssi]APF19581.1 CRISPR-associated protein Csm1 [Caldithrix abyssi DSM 13497]EHO39708.1 CRISPR-associated protein, Csm1 family [Caldithrix abyssi DSM 13497]